MPELVIALTSIPPRFAQLPRVLGALAGLGADRVVLALPRHYRRYGPAPPLVPPPGITVIDTPTDPGPAAKLLPAARAFPGADILCCDDDWHYGPGWLAAFRAARKTRPRAVLAGSTWPTERIGRRGGTIAQGFAGLLVNADAAATIPDPPPLAWAVDDLWLSGHFAAQGLDIVAVPAARADMTPLESPGALQDSTPRDEANRAAAALIQDKFGIWPPR